MTPAQIIGQRLADARRRGESFEAAWPAAVTVALDGQRPGELGNWRHALAETEAAWSAAWDRRAASGPQAALLAVGEPEDDAVAA